MTDYMQTLTSICLTMATGVVIVGSVGLMVTTATAIRNMLRDEW